MKSIALFLVLAAAGGSQVETPSVAVGKPSELLAAFEALNSACRGGRGDDPRTAEACTGRDKAYRRLEALRWCFGRPGEFEYAKQWERCLDD